MFYRLAHDRIVRLIRHFPVVAIIGPRQVGKTTLARMLISDLSNPAFYMDLENPADYARLDDAPLFLQANRFKLVVIDEIQRKPDLFPVLRSEIDKHRVPGRFILLGSASPDLLQQCSETLAGRIIYVELTPLNRLEIKESIPYKSHWIKGGFPEPLQLNQAELVREWFNSFVLTFIERDLRMLGLNANPMLLSRLVSMISHNHGQILNKSNLAKSLDLSVPTISTYLDYLENAFIIKRLQPFFINTKKRLAKSPKIFLRDSGLLHHFFRIESYNDLLGHPYIGHSWEGYVIEQICSVFGNRFEYFFYRTQDGAETDLVLTQKYEPIACVEIKFTSSPRRERGLTSVVRDLDTRSNFIIIPGQITPFPLTKDFTVCGLDFFLEGKAF